MICSSLESVGCKSSGALLDEIEFLSSNLQFKLQTCSYIRQAICHNAEQGESFVISIMPPESLALKAGHEQLKSVLENMNLKVVPLNMNDKNFGGSIIMANEVLFSTVFDQECHENFGYKPPQIDWGKAKNVPYLDLTNEHVCILHTDSIQGFDDVDGGLPCTDHHPDFLFVINKCEAIFVFSKRPFSNQQLKQELEALYTKYRNMTSLSLDVERDCGPFQIRTPMLKLKINNVRCVTDKIIPWIPTDRNDPKAPSALQWLDDCYCGSSNVSGDAVSVNMLKDRGQKHYTFSLIDHVSKLSFTCGGVSLSNKAYIATNYAPEAQEQTMECGIYDGIPTDYYCLDFFKDNKSFNFYWLDENLYSRAMFYSLEIADFNKLAEYNNSLHFNQKGSLNHEISYDHCIEFSYPSIPDGHNFSTTLMEDLKKANLYSNEEEKGCGSLSTDPFVRTPNMQFQIKDSSYDLDDGVDLESRSLNHEITSRVDSDDYGVLNESTVTSLNNCRQPNSSAL